MHKFKTVFLAVVLSLALAAPSYAFFGSTTNNTTNNIDNSVVNKGGHGGSVGDIDNKNTNTNLNTNLNSTKVDNENINRNVNENKNTNKTDVDVDASSRNTNMNVLGQGQDQVQGQAQAQANRQKTTITFQADKREHISGHAAPSTDVQLKDTVASSIRSRGSLLDRVDYLTMDMAKRASKNASDMDVEPAVMFENDFSLDTIKVGTGERFAGYIYVFSDGSDSYLAAMDAKAAEVAMELGMTHITRLGDVEITKVLQGSSWNIGISGGASIMTQGEDMAIAPNGGLGFGAANSKSEYRPDAVYEVSYSAGLIREK
jgi:hypothetical protein